MFIPVGRRAYGPRPPQKSGGCDRRYVVAMFEERANQRHGIKAMPLATLLWLVFHMLLFRKSKSLQLFDNFLGGPVPTPCLGRFSRRQQPRAPRSALQGSALWSRHAHIQVSCSEPFVPRASLAAERRLRRIACGLYVSTRPVRCKLRVLVGLNGGIVFRRRGRNPEINASENSEAEHCSDDTRHRQSSYFS